MDLQIQNTGSGEGSLVYMQSDGNISLLPCCENTLNTFIKNNSMMVCGECKRIIKCFKSEVAFKNYVKFCVTKNREISIGKFRDQDLVIYQAYK